jgi:hypothetical protein
MYTYEYETHLFALTHTDRYGRKSERTHPENINVGVSHLVLLPVDEDDAPIFAIRAFSLDEARSTTAAHGLTDYAIWERLPNRSFAPLAGAK